MDPKTEESLEPIFNFEKRNLPPVCGSCGGKMVETMKEYLTDKTSPVNILICTKCGKYFHVRSLLRKYQNKKEIFEELNRKNRGEGIYNNNEFNKIKEG